MALPSYEEIVKKAKDKNKRVRITVVGDCNDADYEEFTETYSVKVPEDRDEYFSKDIYDVLKRMQDEFLGKNVFREFSEISRNLEYYFDKKGNLKTEKEIKSNKYAEYEDFHKEILKTWTYKELKIACEFTPIDINFGLPAHTLENIKISV